MSDGNIVTRFDDWLDEEISPRRAIVTYGILAAYLFFLLMPVLWLIGATFKTRGALLSGQLRILPLPHEATVDHYLRVFAMERFQRYLLNSIVISFSTTFLAIACGLLAGYATSRFDFPGRDYLILAFLSTQMLPYVLILLPFVILMISIGLVNTYVGIVMAHSVAAIPLATWLLKGFIDTIPQSLDDAARIDGCSYLQVLRHVILPLSAPGISVAGFYVFIVSWSDYLFVSVIARSTDMRTLPFGLQLFQDAQAIDWSGILTISFITMVPPILVFLYVQNYIIEGLASSGLKG